MECLGTGLVSPDPLLTTPSQGLPPPAPFPLVGDTVTVTGSPAGNDSRRDIPPPVHPRLLQISSKLQTIKEPAASRALSSSNRFLALKEEKEKGGHGVFAKPP